MPLYCFTTVSYISISPQHHVVILLLFYFLLFQQQKIVNRENEMKINLVIMYINPGNNTGKYIDRMVIGKHVFHENRGGDRSRTGMR